MFAKSDGQCCNLGIPDQRLTADDLEYFSPFISKIGGEASWHDILSAPCLSNLSCRHCNSCQSVVLVAQVYAPVDFDRSLYVFCCNKRQCSLSALGWSVIRNQAPKLSVLSCPEQNRTAIVNTSPVKATSIPQSQKASASFWDTLCDEEEGVDEVDFEALLNNRNIELVTNSTSMVSKIININDAVDTASVAVESDMTNWTHMVTTTKLPCYKLNEVQETTVGLGGSKMLDFTGILDSEDEGDDAMIDDGIDNTIDANHIESLLASYMKFEEEEDIVQCLAQEVKTRVGNAGAKAAQLLVSSSVESSGGIGGGGGGGTTISMRNSHINHQHRKKQSQQSEHGDDEELALESKLSRGSRKDKTEQYFLQRLARFPRQVLRYAYDGEPLWMTYPFPYVGDAHNSSSASTGSLKASVGTKNGASGAVDGGRDNHKTSICKPTGATTLSRQVGEPESAIPCCEQCGSARVFECQLNSTLLSFVASNDSDTRDQTEQSPPTSVAVLEQIEMLMGSSIDFGVVAVYVCPLSCYATKNNGTGQQSYTREFLLLQPPAV